MTYPINWLVVFGSAIVPIVVGFIWYHPKVFGNIWMKESGTMPDAPNKSNMGIVFGATVFLSLMLAAALVFAVVHQLHIFSTVMGNPELQDPNSELNTLLKTLIEKYGQNFRTFKHGALHGSMAGFTMALPIVAINALFERKSAKYIFITAGYWIVAFTLMGGIICGFA